MEYQCSCVSKCQNFREQVVVLFNTFLKVGWVHAFTKSIRPKVNVEVRLELIPHTTISRSRTLTITIFTNPSARAGYDTRSIFKWGLTGLISEFSFSTSCLTKAKDPRLSYYLPIAGGKIIGFIPFPRVLVLCEMQLVSFRIWTRVAVSI